MRMLGSVRISTNKRVTVPDELLDALKIKVGDFVLFYEDKGTVTARGEKG